MWHLAELNVARLLRPLDDDENREFVAALAPINAIAESSPGFVWRLTDESGASSSFVEVPELGDALTIVNYSIWTDVDSFRHYVTRSGHVAYLRRRREWFESSAAPALVCWWIPAGERPPVSEAVSRLEHLRAHGPSQTGWPLSRPFPTPGAVDDQDG